MRSIQTKLTAIILACVLLTGLLVGGTGLLAVQQLSNSDSAKIMNLLSESKKDEFDVILSSAEDSAKSLGDRVCEVVGISESGTPLGAEKVDTLMKEAVRDMMKYIGGVVSVCIRFDPAMESDGFGELLFIVNGNKLETVSISDSPVWNDLPYDRAEEGWLKPVSRDSTDDWMISYVAPLKADSGKAMGYVGLDIDGAAFENAMKSVDVYKSGYVFLADAEADVIYHPTLSFGASITELDPQLQVVVNELGNESSGNKLFFYKKDTVNSALAFRTVKNGMRVVVTAPTSEINSERDRLIVKDMIWLICILVLSGAVAVGFSQMIIQPIKELDEAAHKMANGDLSVDISPKTNDELGTLAESLQKTQEQLRQHIGTLSGKAYRDDMTGVRNKSSYLEVMKKYDARMEKEPAEFGIIMFDINFMKETNDAYGHDIGDQLLITGCRIICETFKHSPVFRYGGDEFVALLENEDLDNREELIREFEEKLEENNRVTDPRIKLYLAKGLAVYDPAIDKSFTEVFNRADKAMYEDKKIVKEHHPWKIADGYEGMVKK